MPSEILRVTCIANGEDVKQNSQRIDDPMPRQPWQRHEEGTPLKRPIGPGQLFQERHIQIVVGLYWVYGVECLTLQISFCCEEGPLYRGASSYQIPSAFERSTWFRQGILSHIRHVVAAKLSSGTKKCSYPDFHSHKLCISLVAMHNRSASSRALGRANS